MPVRRTDARAHPATRALTTGALATGVLAAGVLVCAALLGGCASAGDGISTSGRVVDTTIELGAPALAVPAPGTGLDPKDRGAGTGATPRRSTASTAAVVAGLGAVSRVASIPVEVGDRVRAGRVVAVFDASALDAAVRAAIAARATAEAQIRVLDARLDDTSEARATIAENRATITDTIADATAARAELEARLAAARRQLAELEALAAKVAQLREAAALMQRPGAVPGGLPGGSVPGTATPTGSPSPRPPSPPGGAALPDPAKLAAGIARLKAGIAQMEAALDRIDAGVTKARTALGELDAASADVSDAEAALQSARTVARAALAGRTVAVRLAAAQRDLAVVRTPVDGLIVATAQAGEGLVPGTPVVVVRPDATSAVDVWVAAEAASRVRPGDRARVFVDSRPGEVFDAHVATRGVRATFPPSWFSTSEVHMTRAVPVRVTLDDPDVTLPPGTPADVRIAATADR